MTGNRQDRPQTTTDAADSAAAVTGEAMVAALNELLEGERAGARVARVFSAETENFEVSDALRRIGRDEAWCCAMLTRHIARLGGRVSRKTGEFHDRALRRVTLIDRLEYLQRGQDQVVNRLRTLLPGDADPKLDHDLQRMLTIHVRNVARCAQLAEALHEEGTS